MAEQLVVAVVVVAVVVVAAAAVVFAVVVAAVVVVAVVAGADSGRNPKAWKVLEMNLLYQKMKMVKLCQLAQCFQEHHRYVHHCSLGMV